MIPRAPLPAGGGARKTKNLSRVREVCARVEDDGVHPYLVVRGGHCGPARLLPIIMANESTEAVWHIPSPCPPPVSGCGRRASGSGPWQEPVGEELPCVAQRLGPVRTAQADRH